MTNDNRRDHIHALTAEIARHSRQVGVAQSRDDSAQADEPKQPAILIDLDGFFKPLTEMGELSPAEILSCLPLNDAEAVRALTLHQLFRTALLLTSDDAYPGDAAILNEWSKLCLGFAVVGARSGIQAPDNPWKTFYSDDLHRHMQERHPETSHATLELSMDHRLVAWTDTANGKIRVSALTRDYLLRINIYLANLSELVVEEGRTFDRGDAQDFFRFVFVYMTHLHRGITPTVLPIARPRNRGTFSFAQQITQIQTGFLLSHEFAHVILANMNDLSRSEIEHRCDDFAFDKLTEFEIEGWEQFLAIRWLFELLAFDRVFGECLSFTRGDWTSDIDWLQLELRDRRRIQTMIENDACPSVYENVGSAFLLELKAILHDLGPDALHDLVTQLRKDAPLQSGAALGDRVKLVLAQTPPGEANSVSGLLRAWKLNTGGLSGWNFTSST